MNFTKLYDWNENTVEFHVVHVNKCVELVCLCGCGGKGKNFKNPPIVSTFNITSFKKVSTIRLSTHPVLKVNHFYHYSNKCSSSFAFYGENFKMFFPKDS